MKPHVWNVWYVALCAFTLWTAWRTNRVNEQLTSAVVTLRMAKEAVEGVSNAIGDGANRLLEEWSEVKREWAALRRQGSVGGRVEEFVPEYAERTRWSRGR